MATDTILDLIFNARQLLADALAMLDQAGLNLPAAHVEHALQILEETGAGGGAE